MSQLLRLLATLMLLGALASPLAAGAEQTIPFVTIGQGSRSAIETRMQVVVRTHSAWQALWRRHTARKTQTPHRVDFSQHMVIAVFAGSVDGGTRASIVKVFRQAGRLYVRAVVVPAPPGRPEPLDAPTVTPFHIVRLARSRLPVTFVFGKPTETYRPGR